VAKPIVTPLREIVLSVVLTAAISCAAPATIEPESRLIRTEAEAYRARVTPTAVTLTIVSTFTNTTQDTVILHPCAQHPPYPLAVSLQRRENGDWRTVLSPVCTLMLMSNPPRLLPGQARTDTVRLEGSRTPNTFPQFPPGSVAGIYRLAYSSVYRRWYQGNPPPDARNRLGEPLADSLLVSNPFRVTE
jgi:hypothetical protein